MKFSSLGAAVVLAAGSASAQPAAQPARGDLSAMNDEFNATTLDKKWARYDQRYGWPNKLKRFDVHTTTAGALHMEPFDSAWVRDRSAPTFSRRWKATSTFVPASGFEARVPRRRQEPGRWAG
jgi:hypothetical protein